MPNGMALDVYPAPTGWGVPGGVGANGGPGAIVMGLDQHRAQIAAEWLDTATGEVGRARLMPGDRAGVRRFLARFEGRALEVALVATTGWRFVVEELARSALWRIWPSRPRPVRCVGTRSAPRQTALTPAICASCS